MPFGLPYAGDGSRITDLILRAGDIRARGAAERGDILGETISGLGQLAGQTFAAAQERQQAEEQRAVLAKRDEALFGLMGNPEATVEDYARVAGPRDGIDIFRAVQATRAQKPGISQEDAIKLLPVQLRGFRKLSDEGKAMAYPALRDSVVGAGLLRAEGAPEEFSPDFMPYLEELERGLSKPEEIKPGVGYRDPISDEIEVPLPEAEKPDTRSIPLQLADPNLSEEQRQRLLAATREYEAAQAAGRPTAAPAKRTLTPTAEANLITSLNRQWTQAAAPAVEIDRQVKLMEAGLDAAKKGNMAAGSQAVLVTFQKILDPTSVVRESEYARSAAGQALLARVQGAFEKLARGGAGVPVAQLEEFANLAREAAKAFSGGHLQAVKKRIGFVADKYELPLEAIIEDYEFAADRPKVQLTDKHRSFIERMR